MPPSAPRLHKIEASLDRFQEAHYWIHMLEEHYHQADPFRWYLNAFLKAIKEVPLLLASELQNEHGFKALLSHKLQGSASCSCAFPVHGGSRSGCSRSLSVRRSKRLSWSRRRISLSLHLRRFENFR